MATKTDMDRIGLFSEVGYLLGDKYTGKRHKFNESANKGKQMLPGGSKTKSSKQDGYFEDKFNRVFAGEAYSDPIKIRRLDRLNSLKKNIGKSWNPSGSTKISAGAGNHYATFSGNINAFSPLSKSAGAHQNEKRNFTTRPPKQGTGYGYHDVAIGDPIRYASEPFDRAEVLNQKENSLAKKQMKGSAFKLGMHEKEFFDDNPFRSEGRSNRPKTAEKPKENYKPFRPSNPGKVLGGCKAGTFDPYPVHSVDPFKKYVFNAFREQKPGEKVFVPNSGPKGYPISSVLEKSVVRQINQTNFNHVESCY